MQACARFHVVPVAPLGAPVGGAQRRPAKNAKNALPGLLQSTTSFGRHVTFRQNISARSRGVSGRTAVRVRSLQAGGFEEGLPRYTPEQPEKDLSKLEVGSIVVVTEMPEFVKTSNSMAALRIAKDVISLGDPGRIMQRKLKGYWVVRFKNGAYLIDEKYFTPIEQTQ
mmetsp:Transcript_9025/g.15502  ORF Transcript_9025/g.15502 Transcript_9025/m.15502 type:complete len:168 (-) Transcript_9025:156-659(-)|eukprot:CAMPEP_0198211756 /NCGR_PEP_ID=MMETSP1445-20131203/25324_1 /TAXON_ID=36898 /ORGANISM="Pyramimonas sp., Strain CCMP2087" /LENGTH=167 /DNA_ID=CAMNT_0043886085 /DNA_START=81 /DNA_END=584 /DNA_ORIENTATION=+